MNPNPQARLASLDVFRGVIITGMILVTDPGTYDAVYPQLRHAEWIGATLTDMIFPSFLFMVGMSIAFSISSRVGRGLTKGSLAKHIIYRSLVLLLLGLAVNGFPDYNWPMLRLPGILQRIALCYLCCGLVYLYYINKDGAALKGSSIKTGAVALGLLVVYWALLVLVPVPGIGSGHLDSYGNLPAYIDRSVLGINHLWAYGLTPGKGVTYDPEGMLSTLPAIASTLIGMLAGDWWLLSSDEGKKKIIRLSIAGALLVICGLLLGLVLPINKRIWTSSFAVLSSGAAIIFFSIIYYITDLKKICRWSFPFLVLGTNAILAFVLSGVITTLFDRIHISTASGQLLTLHQSGYQFCLSSGLSPVNASLAYAIVIVVLNILILLPLYLKKIFVKI